MSLSDEQHKKLLAAIKNYSFPRVAFDFNNGEEVSYFDSYRSLEKYIRDQLLSSEISAVKDGLSNVLYWGYASSHGRQSDRVGRFRNSVSNDQLQEFMNVSSRKDWSLSNIKKCGLPQFSGISFISKVMMFINPKQYVTLDLQLKRIKDAHTPTLFRDLVSYRTSLPVNNANEVFYSSWCDLCRRIANKHFTEINALAVDVERGIFSLVKENEIEFVAECLNTA